MNKRSYSTKVETCDIVNNCHWDLTYDGSIFDEC